MSIDVGDSCTAFEGFVHLASGPRPAVAVRVKKALGRGQKAPVLVFDDRTGEQIDFDLRGSNEQIIRRLQPTPTTTPPAALDAPPSTAATTGHRGPGRPKLGVVAREVTLLPRHWEWLSEQPGGASVALRKLVEEARRANEGKDRLRRAQEAAYRFMSALGGNLAGFEEASRALFAGSEKRFATSVAAWPADVRDHALGLAARAFEARRTATTPVAPAFPRQASGAARLSVP